MTINTFRSLTAAQQTTLLIAMMVRSNLDPMHIAQLSNLQMKELNRVIRFSIYDAVTIIREVSSDFDQADYFAWLVERIPDYWEVPGRDPKSGLEHQRSQGASHPAHG